MPRVGGIAAVLRRLIGNSALRRVLFAYLIFSTAEYGTSATFTRNPIGDAR